MDQCQTPRKVLDSSPVDLLIGSKQSIGEQEIKFLSKEPDLISFDPINNLD